MKYLRIYHLLKMKSSKLINYFDKQVFEVAKGIMVFISNTPKSGGSEWQKTWTVWTGVGLVSNLFWS